MSTQEYQCTYSRNDFQALLLAILKLDEADKIAKAIQLGVRHQLTSPTAMSSQALALWNRLVAAKLDEPIDFEELPMKVKMTLLDNDYQGQPIHHFDGFDPSADQAMLVFSDDKAYLVIKPDDLVRWSIAEVVL